MYGTSRSHNHLQQAWWGIMGWKLILTSNVRSVSWHKHSKVWFAGFYVVNCKMPSTHGCNDGPISLRRYVGVHNGLSHLWSARTKWLHDGPTCVDLNQWFAMDLQTLRPLLEVSSLWKVKSFPIWCVLEKGPNCMVTKIEEDRIPKVFWDMCFFRTTRNIGKIWQNPPKTAIHLQFTRSKWTCRKANYFMQMLSWSMYFHISLWFHLIG